MKNLYPILLVIGIVFCGAMLVLKHDEGIATTNPTAIDSRREGEPNAVEILRARDPNGFWLGNVYLAHDVEVVSEEEALRLKVTPLIREEIQKMADEGRLILLDPNTVFSESYITHTDTILKEITCTE